MNPEKLPPLEIEIPVDKEYAKSFPVEFIKGMLEQLIKTYYKRIRRNPDKLYDIYDELYNICKSYGINFRDDIEDYSNTILNTTDCTIVESIDRFCPENVDKCVCIKYYVYKRSNIIYITSFDIYEIEIGD
jgi:hypothetical protein